MEGREEGEMGGLGGGREGDEWDIIQGMGAKK